MDARRSLRRWVAERNPGLSPEALHDRTPLIEARYLTSLHVPELLLFLEELTGRPIDPRALRAGAFRDIETISTTFLGDGDA